jgi:hypothetical protein
MEQELLDRLPLLASDEAFFDLHMKTEELRRKIAEDIEFDGEPYPGDEVRLTLFEARLAKYELFKAAQTERKEAS